MELAALMTQEAPYPNALLSLVQRVSYKQGWFFALQHIDRGQGSAGLTLRILVTVPDGANPDQEVSVYHYMIVPAASYNERSWQHWLFDQILLVERHESMEFFKIDGERPYAPLHSPGNDPYLISELRTTIEQRTDFRGRVLDEDA